MLILLTACEEEESNNCGNVSISIDGNSVSYLPQVLQSCYLGNVVQVLNDNISAIALNFISNCNSSNLSFDYSISIDLYTSGISLIDFAGSTFDISSATYSNYNCQPFPISNTYNAVTNSIGTLLITNFNYSTNPALISGNFEIESPGKPSITCTFNDVPTNFYN